MKHVKEFMMSACLAVILVSSVAWSSPGRVIDDATITAKVKAALIGNSATKAYQINVDTKSGVVQLNGFVDSSSARSEAEKSALDYFTEPDTIRPSSLK